MQTAAISLKHVITESSIQNLEKYLSGQEGIERALLDIKKGEMIINYNNEVITLSQILSLIEHQGLCIS
ncbi:hypothetical protein [Bacillus sp. MUM 13]|uniref:hypothetical protein n=1 Tax=Bacillus sp. MUM 13 TaxID=1678001 RepID=UPI0008F594D5|nr:hypothetical protein [Bacillus sp. MUM 13]OIK12101.1 hypothetical protein BIV59_09965 [Bacillus sp. MUM 13]